MSPSTSSSSSVKTIAALVDVVASRAPSSLALLSPCQKQTFTYQQLAQTTRALAAWLRRYGYAKNHVLMSDLPNTSENLILQLACNRLGVHYGKSKNFEMMSKFKSPHLIQGAVSANRRGFLANATHLPLPYLGGDFLTELIHGGGLDEFSSDKTTGNVVDDEEEQEDDSSSSPRIHAFYNSTIGYTNQHALTHGHDAAQQLHMTDNDVVCISVTLCHAFGMGSAVCSALSTGATIVLPAVGGIQGCGIPKQRATATVQVLTSEQCTLLFCDTFTLQALPVPSSVADNHSLRGGACKISSGPTFLDGTVEYAGVKLRTVGSKKPTPTASAASAWLV